MRSTRLAAALAVTLMASVPFAWTLGRQSPAHQEGSSGDGVRQYYRFTELAQMVGLSDAVVVGQVSEVRPGRTIDPIDAPPLSFVEVDAVVQEVWSGTIAGSLITLEIDEGLFPDLARSNRVWPLAGARYVLFLHEKTDRLGIYRPVTSQGVLLLGADGLEPADRDDSFAAALAGRSLAALQSDVAAAVDSLERGEVVLPEQIP